MKALVFISISIIILASCSSTTTRTWRKPVYTESINHFLITEDYSQTVFIGNYYHYIFKDQDSLNSVLNWEYRNLIKVSFTHRFYVSPSNTISGKYTLSIGCNAINIEQKEWLIANDFIESHEFNDCIYSRTSIMTGTRYLSNNVQFSNLRKTIKPYNIIIEREPTILDVAGSIALTPIAVAHDGVTTVGAAGVLLISLPFVVLDYISNVNKN